MPETRNLFQVADQPLDEELFEELLRGTDFRLERIVSHGHTTPLGQWYDQDQEEWVLLLSGGQRRCPGRPRCYAVGCSCRKLIRGSEEVAHESPVRRRDEWPW